MTDASQALFVFAENTSVTSVNSMKNSPTASENYTHKSAESCLTSDAAGRHQCSVQSSQALSASLSCDQQRQRDASSNFSNIFQTSDLELTDADLEFDLR